MLCDLEIWHNAPNDLLKSLLEHLLELASESSEKRSNIRIMRDLQLVTKLLHIIADIHEVNTSDILFQLLSILLGSQPRNLDLLLFGQYIVSKIPLVTYYNINKSISRHIKTTEWSKLVQKTQQLCLIISITCGINRKMRFIPFCFWCIYL